MEAHEAPISPSTSAATCEEKSKVGGWGEGWRGRGEEGESQGLLLPRPCPHTQDTLVALPPPASAQRALPPGWLCEAGGGEEGTDDGEGRGSMRAGKRVMLRVGY